MGPNWSFGTACFFFYNFNENWDFFKVLKIEFFGSKSRFLAQQFNFLIRFADEVIQESFVKIEFLNKNLTFRKLRIVTDLNKSELKCAKNTCQTMIVMNK